MTREEAIELACQQPTLSRALAYVAAYEAAISTRAVIVRFMMGAPQPSGIDTNRLTHTFEEFIARWNALHP